MSLRKSILIFVSFMCAVLLAQWLTPKFDSTAQSNEDKLENLIPTKFGEWHVDDSLPIILGDPDTEALLNTIYSQTLSRTYINTAGQRVMLAIAYGTVQNKELQVHFPEVCYPAQGYQLISEVESTMKINGVDIPVKQLETIKGRRDESVTYWVRVGQDIVTSRFQQKISTIKYGLQGMVVDGLLYRVSSVGLDSSEKLHAQFTNDLINSAQAEAINFLLADRLSEVVSQ